MIQTDDKHPRRRIMEVEEIADEKEEKKVMREEPIAPRVIPDEKEAMVTDMQEEFSPQKEALPFEGLAREQQKEKEMEREQFVEQPIAPKKDIVSELFHTNETTVSYPDVTVGKKSKGGIPVFVWIILLFVIVGCIGGGLIFFKNSSSSTTESPSGTTATITLATSPTPTETPTPIASPSAAVKKTITVQIWNGSGKSGAASLMKELLEEKGYVVKSTGNAPSFSKEPTAIYIKSDKKQYLDTLKSDVEEKYTIGTVSASLDENVAYDARVIVGQE